MWILLLAALFAVALVVVLVLRDRRRGAIAAGEERFSPRADEYRVPLEGEGSMFALGHHTGRGSGHGAVDVPWSPGG